MLPRQQTDGNERCQTEQYRGQRKKAPRILEHPGQLACRASQRRLHIIPREDMQRQENRKDKKAGCCVQNAEIAVLFTVLGKQAIADQCKAQNQRKAEGQRHIRACAAACAAKPGAKRAEQLHYIQPLRLDLSDKRSVDHEWDACTRDKKRYKIPCAQP